jgi:nucleoside-diphosphate-sugar epimerase
VERAVFVSTTALFTTLNAPSKSVRTAAEDAVRGSGLRWTIVRPTMIYGAPGDRNVERLLRAVRKWRVIPVPGSGKSLLQPVHVEDLADGIVAAWRTPAAVTQAYDLSGGAPLTFLELIDAAGAACGRSVLKPRLPLSPVVLLLRGLERIGLPFRIKAEQVLRLAEDKAFSHAAAARDLGYRPRTFPAGVREEARLLGFAPETEK